MTVRIIVSASGRIIVNGSGREITNGGGTVTVTGITLTPSTGTANSPAGTVVGTLAATVTGGTLTSPVWTLTNTAGGDFQLVNGNQVAFLPSNVPANSYTIHAQVASANAATFGQDLGITVSAPSALSAPLSLTNSKSTVVAANSPITIAHAFKRGDVPSGYSVAVSGMSVQQDQEAYWDDGSLRVAALALKDTSRSYGANGGGSDTQSMTVTASSSAPVRTPAFSLASLTATTDFKILLSGFDCGSDTYSVSLNDIAAAVTADQQGDAGAVTLPSGASVGATSFAVSSFAHLSIGQTVSADGVTRIGSVTGISGSTVTISGSGLPNAVSAGGSLYFNQPIATLSPIRSGPNCMEWKAESFIRVKGGANDGKYHCQVFGTLYIRAWGLSGPYEIECLLEISRVYGNNPYATMGPTTSNAQRFICNATVQNGSTVIAYFGGPNDPRACVIPASDITQSTAAITGLGFDGITGISFGTAAGGTLPAGLSTATPYWEVGGLIATDRNNASGANSPTNVPTLTSAGSGNINVYPTLSVFPCSAASLVSVTAEPIWIAGSSGISVRPHLMPTYDPTYLEASGVTGIHYDRSKTLYPRTTYTLQDRGLLADLSVYYPGLAQPWQTPFYISQYGDDPGDERVGYNTNLSANLLIMQTDPVLDMMVRNSAHRFWDYCFNVVNDRSGKPMSQNNGLHQSGVAYAGLGPIDYSSVSGANFGYFPFLGSAYNTVNWSGHQSAYGPLIDEAHLPTVSNIAYLRTGHRSYLDQMQRLCGCLTFVIYNRTRTVGSNTYYVPLIIDNDAQMRGHAWRLKAYSHTEFMSPTADLYTPYLSDQLNQTSAYFIDYYNNGMPSYQKALGLFNLSGSNNYLCAYQYTYFTISLAATAQRDQGNQRTGYKFFLSNHVKNCMVKLFDPTQNGGFYIGCDGGPGDYSGNLSFTPDTSNYSLAYQTPQDLWAATPNGALSTPQPSGFNSLTKFAGSYPFDSVDYFTSHLAALAEMDRVDSTTGAAALYSLIHAAATNASDPRAARSGVQWASNSNGHYDSYTPQNYVTWLVKPQSGNAP